MLVCVFRDSSRFSRLIGHISRVSIANVRKSKVERTQFHNCCFSIKYKKKLKSRMNKLLHAIRDKKNSCKHLDEIYS